MFEEYKIIKINENDNVAVAIDDIPAAETNEAVPKGHKIALRDIAEGENVVKYGYPIGHAIVPIKKGQHVHVHNIKTNLNTTLDYKYAPALKNQSNAVEREFMGYQRADGSVGIRNEIWVINTVGCVNKVAERIVSSANIAFAETKGDIEVCTYVHPYGCSQMGDDQVYTQKILAGLVAHPNAAGVLVLGLGCENNNIDEFKKYLGDIDNSRVKFLVAQESEDEVEDGVKIIGELIEYAKQFTRKKISAAKLRVGLKCGGSDGFSGITANPLVGAFSDMLIEAGGISVLSEVPEMFGAETILMNRCETEELFNDTVSLINDFKDYYTRHGQVVYENPSPGNKKGGISTLEDKSLGCTQKGGTSNVAAVLNYGEHAAVPGLNLLQGPGNDIVAITALAASGAHIILFTTGRGTPVGGPVPTVKIATNTDLAQKKSGWIDFNAGSLLEGVTMEELRNEFFDYVMNVASGEKTMNEKNGYKEIAIFKDGVTL